MIFHFFFCTTNKNPADMLRLILPHEPRRSFFWQIWQIVSTFKFEAGIRKQMFYFKDYFNSPAAQNSSSCFSTWIFILPHRRCECLVWHFKALWAFTAKKKKKVRVCRTYAFGILNCDVLLFLQLWFYLHRTHLNPKKFLQRLQTIWEMLWAT